ncbi:tRNA pseudouridine32 synthase / 23S rRNA pseudouridine746 synthase [Paramicrobacterium humi]|uniref:RNA pseudouridylate synthase n=1 Tax=Paramicrobacterium humi TaxID=640635 RepID=A0A1H4JIJ3_9MICO|nr:RluA family pseudouridine synthase [Microbacterium humi]SEB46111.1 tRNA pseudouridine32 synthase / 23S rRNA pseudouridine746 synthase [Microbacterium humi]
MPRSPLPQRHGLDAAWIRTPRERHWATMRDHLVERMPRLAPDRIDEMLDERAFVDDGGTPFAVDAPYRPHTFVWFHRDLPDEVEVPFEIEVLHRDERIVVIDKPHFLSTIPRGRHVQQSVVVRARRALGLPHLVPAHRLDRVTAGVLLLTTEPQWRGAYQSMFEQRTLEKEYEAVAAAPGELSFPATVRSHIVKQRGVMQAFEIEGAPPNAETRIELIGERGDRGLYRAVPHTGKTHQIRLHMTALGLPIIGDPFYPVVTDVAVDDFSAPLQLLAKTLRFVDPVDGAAREFTSRRILDAWQAAQPE